ncbi:MAG: hypothetical protein ABI895_29180 [Deltaproteobacteria bacterium]
MSRRKESTVYFTLFNGVWTIGVTTKLSPWNARYCILGDHTLRTSIRRYLRAYIAMTAILNNRRFRFQNLEALTIKTMLDRIRLEGPAFLDGVPLASSSKTPGVADDP